MARNDERAKQPDARRGGRRLGLDHLRDESRVIGGPGTFGRVIKDRLAETRRFSQLDVAADSAAEDGRSPPRRFRSTLFEESGQIVGNVGRQASPRFVQSTE